MASGLKLLRLFHRRINKFMLAGFNVKKHNFATSSWVGVPSVKHKGLVPLHDFNREPVGEPAPEDLILEEDDYFGVRELVNLHELFAARVYLGHKIGVRHDNMKPYLFGNRHNVDIIDLDKTVVLLQEALNVTAHIAYRKGLILFISRNSRNMPLVEQTAKECGEYAHCRYWYGGTFTNIKDQFGAATRLPDLCIFINTLNSQFEDHIALDECGKMLIPTIGIVDTNCNPSSVTYPVPGNDDTPDSVKLYCRLFKQAILKGKEKIQNKDDIPADKELKQLE